MWVSYTHYTPIDFDIGVLPPYVDLWIMDNGYCLLLILSI